MTNANIDIAKYNALLNRETKRKQNVKLYFTKRNAKFDFYKSFFETHANNDDKKSLQNVLSNIKLA